MPSQKSEIRSPDGVRIVTTPSPLAAPGESKEGTGEGGAGKVFEAVFEDGREEDGTEEAERGIRLQSSRRSGPSRS